MRRLLLLVLLAAAPAVGCGEVPAAGDGSRLEAGAAASPGSPGSPASSAGLERIAVTVPDMACPLCAGSIERALADAGLDSIRVDLDAKRVVGRYDPKRLTPEAVREVVTALGYRVSDVESW